MAVGADAAADSETEGAEGAAWPALVQQAMLTDYLGQQPHPCASWGARGWGGGGGGE